jgi:Tfp pilus assembly protein PilX
MGSAMNTEPRQREAGSTLVLVLILLVILLVVAAIVIRGAASDTGTAGYDRTGKAAFLCAESGLRTGMNQLGIDPLAFSTILKCGSTDGGVPACGSTCVGSYSCPLHLTTTSDGGVTTALADVWIADDVDDNPNDMLTDVNMTVYMTSKCTQPDLPQRQLQILYVAGGGGQYYRNQAGQGSTNAGNQNVQ